MNPSAAEADGPRGPMRLVLTTYPSRARAFTAVAGALAGHLAACGSVVPVESRYWWEGRVQSEAEALVVFKTVPKRVAALFRFLKAEHPYSVPEIVELDVPRVAPGYLEYLLQTLDRVPVPPSEVRAPTRRGGRRGPGARSPGRTRARPRRRSRRTGSYR